MQMVTEAMGFFLTLENPSEFEFVFSRCRSCKCKHTVWYVTQHMASRLEDNSLGSVLLYLFHMKSLATNCNDLH